MEPALLGRQLLVEGDVLGAVAPQAEVLAPAHHHEQHEGAHVAQPAGPGGDVAVELGGPPGRVAPAVVADLLTPPDQRRNVGDNFRVEARIIVWETDQALKVPAGALFRRGAEWAAFVLAEGRAQLRPVKVGRSSGTETQVQGG